MSLAIDIDAVTKVLLADGWHEVAEESFTMDAYEFIRAADGRRLEPQVYLGGGQATGVCETGFEFLEVVAGVRCWIAGPLTSILAVSRKK